MHGLQEAERQNGDGQAVRKTGLLTKTACVFACLTLICGMMPNAAWADEQTTAEEATLFSPVRCSPWNWWLCHKR